MVRPQPAKLLSPVQIWVAPPTIYNYFFTKCGSLAELVDSTGLENRRGLYLPGFESLRVHHLPPPKKRYFKRFNSYHIQLFKKTYFLAFHPISTPREILPFKKTAPQVERSVDTYVGNSSRVIIKESMTQC